MFKSSLFGLAGLLTIVSACGEGHIGALAGGPGDFSADSATGDPRIGGAGDGGVPIGIVPAQPGTDDARATPTPRPVYPPGTVSPSIVKAREANGSTDVCAAPCGVHFDGTGTAWAGHVDEETYLDLDYTWTFDDPNCSEDGDGIFDASQMSCNTQDGTVAAHLFADPGTYTVTLTVTDPVGETSDQTTAQIVVSDPDVVWAGSKTHCISADGTSATCPGGGTTHLSTSDFVTAINTYMPSGGDVRILFERGDTFSTAAGTVNFTPSHQKLLIGAYGSGAKPVINTGSGKKLFGSSCGVSGPAPVDARIANLTMNGSGSDSLFGDQSDTSSRQLTFYDIGSGGTWSGDGIGKGFITQWNSEQSSCCSGNCEFTNQTFIVEVTFPFMSTTRNLTWSAQNFGILGNTFPGSGSDHVIRMVNLSKNVLSRNLWTGPTGQDHQLKFHAMGADDSFWAYANAQEHTVIEGNLYEGTGTGDLFSLGQSNGSTADGCGCCQYNKYMQLLNNYMKDGDGSAQFFAEIHGDYAKAADNICQVDSLGGNTQFTCASFDTRCDGGRGAPTTPIDGHHRARRNQTLDSTTHSNYVRTAYFEQGSENVATDNYLWAPSVSGTKSAVADPNETCGSGLCTSNFSE